MIWNKFSYDCATVNVMMGACLREGKVEEAVYSTVVRVACMKLDANVDANVDLWSPFMNTLLRLQAPSLCKAVFYCEFYTKKIIWKYGSSNKLWVVQPFSIILKLRVILVSSVCLW